MIDLAVEECFAKGRWSELETQDENKNKNEVSDTPKCYVYDPVENEIDFHSIRATDLKSNKRVNIVENADLLHETKCEFLKIKLKETFNKWLNENDNVQYSNLEDDTRQGLLELLTEINNRKAVVFETDKSKNFSINTPENYRSDMQVFKQSYQS